MEKKVLLFGYSKMNFGDDLFVYVLANRYKNINFYIHIPEEKYRRPFENIKNICILEQARNVRDVQIEYFDGFAYVGGSIFMESEYSWHEVKEFNYFIKECNKKNKPFFYITCNFGPYKTEEYLNQVRENFSLSTGVSVRDKKTYEKFKDIPTVTFAPDLAFIDTLREVKSKKKSRNIGISVINIEKREDLKEKIGIYEDYIKRIVIKFAKRGYKVHLFSFCEAEGDEIATQRIKELIPEKYKKRIHTVSYRGNIAEFIKKYSQMNRMICTRFHSMILSIILNQKIYNLCYSKKQENVSNDFSLFEKKENINDLSYESRLETKDFKKINREKYQMLYKEAQKQVYKFEEWLSS